MLAATLHTVVHISRDSKGSLSVSLDSVDQNALGLPGTNAVLKGGIFSFEVPVVYGTYSGTVSSDGKAISAERGTKTPKFLTSLV